MNSVQEKIFKKVINQGLCVGCGACIIDSSKDKSDMFRDSSGTVAVFHKKFSIDKMIWDACPGKGIDYPELYKMHYEKLPSNWKVGHIKECWTGHATDSAIRRAGASGGVITAVLKYLLETNAIDAAIVARQIPGDMKNATFFIARTVEQIILSAQSIYTPVSMLESLRHFIPGERYAMTCVPEISAALRILQHKGHSKAQQVKYVLGPYTGTALEPKGIRSLLRIHSVRDDDIIKSLKWRAGEWPGYLEIKTKSGRVIRSKKVYYNYLIPFYITQTSLRSMDFANEFSDISVGDAWSPKFEKIGKGFSVVVARSNKMKSIINIMQKKKLLTLKSVDIKEASIMHEHMIDFKKRGGYLRNQALKFFRLPSPDFGLRPTRISGSRIIVEIFISLLFIFCRTSVARWFLERFPERIIGPFFNFIRLNWKKISKPIKRSGLSTLNMHTYIPKWKIILKKKSKLN